MNLRAFIKMHGLGNDFVVIDARQAPFAPSLSQARSIADRRLGVGCDQLLIMEPPRNGAADIFLSIRNPDGTEVGACGNGTRCVARLLMAESGRSEVTIETLGGLLKAQAVGAEEVAVDMGPARLDWQEIPLARAEDTLHLDLSLGALSDPVAVNMGNPHAVFFVPDAEAVPLAELGPQLEHNPLFPERANIGIVQVLSRSRLRFRVWERGTGITRACGSGACAAIVAAVRRDLAEREATILLDGGELTIAWRADGHVIMTGPVTTAFSGLLTPELTS